MSTEMKKLIIGGTEYEIVDDAGRTRITALEQGGGGSGTGLSQTEKNLLLTLFEKAAYADNDASEAFSSLSELWDSSTVYRTITWSGTGYTKGNAASRVVDGTPYTSTITANTGFNITAVEVTMGGNTVQGAWNNGTVTIPNVTGDIVITVTTAQITVSSISAVYTQSGTVYDTDSLDSLKSDLVVTATFMDSSTGVIDAADYTLSGTLTAGTSAVTVNYGGKTTTFNVTVTEYVPPSTEYDYEIVGTGVVNTSGGVSNNAAYNLTSFFELDNNYTALTFTHDVSESTVTCYVQFFNGDTYVDRKGVSKTTDTTRQCNYSDLGTVTKARLSYSPNTITNVKIMKGLV